MTIQIELSRVFHAFLITQSEIGKTREESIWWKKKEFYFFHPAAFSRALENFQKYPWSGLYNPDQIVSDIRKTNFGPDVMCFFCVFLWCQGSLLTVIWTPHKLQCNCKVHMNGQQWPWHHRHPWKTKKSEENGRKEGKWRMKVFVEDGSLFIA